MNDVVEGGPEFGFSIEAKSRGGVEVEIEVEVKSDGSRASLVRDLALVEG